MSKHIRKVLIWPLAVLVLAILLNLSLGSVYIPMDYIFVSVFTNQTINETFLKRFRTSLYFDLTYT